VEEQPFVVSNHRRVDPYDVKHAAAVDNHRRAVSAANAVLCVRDLLRCSEGRAAVVGSPQKNLLVFDRVLAVEVAVLKGKINRIVKSSERRLVDVTVRKIAYVHRFGEG